MSRNYRAILESIRGIADHTEPDMYLYLSSSSTERNYPDNTAADFTIQLPRPITDITECGVVEVKLQTAPQKSLLLCSDLCVESIVNSHTLPVLRRLNQKLFIPTYITYVPVRNQSFDTLRLYLSKESGEPANLQGETRVTLHLR